MNRRFPGRMLPHFIDESGRRCAMGYLIEESGERDLVQRVARERNYARIRELADIPELLAWLEANGIGVEEAARIQPAYCGSAARDCVCLAASDGMLEGTVQSAVADGGASLMVTAVYGHPIGVQVGDVVPLHDNGGIATPGGVIWAVWSPVGFAYAKYSPESQDGGEPLVTVPVSDCSLLSERAVIPGPIPVSVLRTAVSQSTDLCVETLARFDSRWGAMQGGPECFPVDSGCANSGTGSTPGIGLCDAGAEASQAHARTAGGGGCDVVTATHAGGAEAMAFLGAALVLHRIRRRAK